MIASVLNIVGQQIEALDWVERYGGLVQTYREKVNDDGLFNVYPISCGVSEADCINDQRYQDLIPDDTKSSIVYFETLQGLRDAGSLNANNNVMILTGTFRLVAWLNYQKLGINECYASDKAQKSLYKILNRYYDKNMPDVLQNATIQFRIQSFVPKDYQTIFSKYNYQDLTGYWMYPFDYFAINVNVRMTLPMCDYDFTPQTPIDCIDDSRIL